MSLDRWLKMLRRGRAGQFLSHWLCAGCLLLAGCAPAAGPAPSDSLVTVAQAGDETIPIGDGDPANVWLKVQLSDEITCMFLPPTTVREAFEMLAEEMEIPIDLDADADQLAAAAPPLKLHLTSTPVGAVLAAVGRRAKLGYTLERGRVRILPADKIAAQ